MLCNCEYTINTHNDAQGEDRGQRLPFQHWPQLVQYHPIPDVPKSLADHVSKITPSVRYPCSQLEKDTCIDTMAVISTDLSIEH